MKLEFYAYTGRDNRKSLLHTVNDAVIIPVVNTIISLNGKEYQVFSVRWDYDNLTIKVVCSIL